MKAPTRNLQVAFTLSWLVAGSLVCLIVLSPCGAQALNGNNNRKANPNHVKKLHSHNNPNENRNYADFYDRDDQSSLSFYSNSNTRSVNNNNDNNNDACHLNIQCSSKLLTMLRRSEKSE